MTTLPTNERTSGGGVAAIGTAVSWSDPRLIFIGFGMALGGAVLLVLRAYLPRWIFGAPTPLSWIWPVSVFVSYIGLGIVALLAMAAADHWLSRRKLLPLWRRMLLVYLLIVKATGLVVALVIGPITTKVLHLTLLLTNMWIFSSTLGITLYVCLLLNRTSAVQRDQALQAQLETDQLDTALARAELSMIEAQIEPHFLFNTLAHVKRQYRIDTAAADHMLADLIEYLERAAPALQRSDWTVGDELDLVRVYLDILTYRFGERLQFTITASDVHRMLRIPALTVATLVENAVRHGISPKPEGGAVRVTVDADNDSLVIQVSDNGVGLRQASGSGLGLATVRACLRSRFGERAVLRVEPAEPAGVRAAIRIPQEA
ncbi:MAG: sensor histidine kinase [Burkholderiaceae bacterium]